MAAPGEDSVGLAESRLARAAGLLIAIGMAVRLWVLTERGSLFLDEASLALNVLARDVRLLTQPLDWGQAGPIGFLWIERVAVLSAGSAEWVLRLAPFLGGVAIPVLTWLVGVRTVGRRAALYATAACVASLIAIRYSSEVKPYSTDAAVAIGLVLFALRLRERPNAPARWLALGVAGVLGVFVSLPAAFVLGAVGLSLLGQVSLRRLAGCGAAWIAVFALQWWLALGESSASAYLKEYWAPVMLAPVASDFVARAIRAAAALWATPLQWTGALGVTLVAVGLGLCGVGRIARSAKRDAALLIGPAALAAVASVASLYPLSDRLAFFAAPGALLCAAACVDALVVRAGGLMRIAERWPSARTATPYVIAAAVAAWVGADSLRMLRAPGALEPTRTLFETIAAEAARDSSPVYVYARAVPAWVYATTDWAAHAAGDSAEIRRVARVTRLAGDVRSPAHENFAREGAVAVGEGDSLVVSAADVRGVDTRAGASRPPVELLGLAPGVRYRIAGPTRGSGPSPGWVPSEARRIMAAAVADSSRGSSRGTAVWLVASHFFEGTGADELRPLVVTLIAMGAQITEERRGGRDAIALKVTVAP
ncbi:MAG: glycosyltransferase family 39 protein [Gemmatimonadetes bacterium]|nr:glycosyltransferase family 39 protein [Gemmatimonadota bacterium]